MLGENGHWSRKTLCALLHSVARWLHSCTPSRPWRHVFPLHMCYGQYIYALECPLNIEQITYGAYTLPLDSSRVCTCGSTYICSADVSIAFTIDRVPSNFFGTILILWLFLIHIFFFFSLFLNSVNSYFYIETSYIIQQALNRGGKKRQAIPLSR